MLILIVRHQIDQHIGNQQNEPLKPSGQQRQTQQWQHGLGNEFQLFAVHTFIQCFHGIHNDRSDHRY